MDEGNKRFNSLIFKGDNACAPFVSAINRSECFELVHITASVSQIFHTLAVMKIDVVFLNGVRVEHIRDIRSNYPNVAVVVYFTEAHQVDMDLIPLATDALTLPVQEYQLQLTGYRVGKHIKGTFDFSSGPFEKNKLCQSIPIREGAETRLVCQTELMYLKSDGEYIRYHTSSNKYLSLGALKHIVNTLPAEFLQVHRSYVVNRAFITSISGSGISLLGGIHIPVGRTFRKEVRKVVL